MEKILQNIKHVVVLMMENRSFDNLTGWLYDQNTSPQNWVTNDPNPQYMGLAFGSYSNPDNSGKSIPVQKGADNTFVPSPDPNEIFDHMTAQQYWGTTNPKYGTTAPMDGFVRDYAKSKNNPVAADIMQTYTPEQVSVMSFIAQNFAISDYWFGACPTQTLPNRGFMGAGTSEGRVNNLTFPYIFGATTIFNVLSSNNVSWKIYNQPKYFPSLTRIMFDKLWVQPESHFGDIDDFISDCNSSSLPAYTFLEPTFLDDPFATDNTATSEHPPSNVAAGESFLQTVWNGLVNSPSWENTLFILTYDEHGGNYDHVPPPWGCVPPDSKSDPGHENFSFNRWGVRVPTIMASAYIPQGTVFRSTKENVQYDHTSILATVLKWCGIENNDKVLGKRVAKAPTFEEIVSLSQPRTDKVCVDNSLKKPEPKDRSTQEMTDLEHGILRAFLMYSHDGKLSEEEINHQLKSVSTLGDAINFLTANKNILRLKTRG